MRRPTDETRGDKIRCPRCGGLMWGAHFELASVFFTCRNKVGIRSDRRNCSAHVYLHCDAGACTVVPVSREEYEALAGRGLPPAEILRRLDADRQAAA